jgi:hypothetical protein
MPTIVVTDAQLDGKAVCHFAAPGGGQNPGMEVQLDFEVIAAQHNIAAQGGGCYYHQAINAEGKHEAFIGGMYVPYVPGPNPRRLIEAVWQNFAARGYALIEPPSG